MKNGKVGAKRLIHQSSEGKLTFRDKADEESDQVGALSIAKKTNSVRQMTALSHMSPTTFTSKVAHRCRFGLPRLLDGNSPFTENKRIFSTAGEDPRRKSTTVNGLPATFVVPPPLDYNELTASVSLLSFLPFFLPSAERGISSADRTHDPEDAAASFDSATASRRTEARLSEEAPRTGKTRREGRKVASEKGTHVISTYFPCSRSLVMLGYNFCYFSR